MGTKRSVLTDEKGLLLPVVLSGANTHDTKLLEETLDKIVISRPVFCEEHPQNLCLDAGYTDSTQSVEECWYTAHIRPRGEERKERDRSKRCVNDQKRQNEKTRLSQEWKKEKIQDRSRRK